MRARLAILLLALAACESNDPGTQALDARIVTADGADPFTIGTFDHLRLEFAQEGLEPVVREIDLTEQTFEVGLDLDLFIPDARVRVTLTGPSGTLHGAPPRFPPAATFGFLRITVGEPGTCAVVPRFEAPPPARTESAYLHWEGFVIQLGGAAASGLASAVTFSDLYWAAAGDDTLPGLPAPAGRSKAAIFGEIDALVLAEGGGPWRYGLTASDEEAERASPITLYADAGIDSAIARSAAGAVLVAGGGPTATPSAELAAIRGDGRVDTAVLVGARTGAGAGTLGDAILVAGGARGAEAPFAELVDLATLTSIPIDDPTAEAVRRDPLVIEGATSSWVLGGSDETGAPLTNSWVVSGCPGACALTPGPEVAVGLAPRHEGTFVHDGVSVWRAVEEGGWHLEPIADLVHSRDAAGITAFESGILFVHGGADADGPRADGELCFPETLTPL